MVLRNMPHDVAELLSEELTLGNCDACGNEGVLVQKRNDYILDRDDSCRNCYYYKYFFGRPVTEAYLTPVKEICFECLDEFNEDYEREMLIYK